MSHLLAMKSDVHLVEPQTLFSAMLVGWGQWVGLLWAWTGIVMCHFILASLEMVVITTAEVKGSAVTTRKSGNVRNALMRIGRKHPSVPCA